MAKKPLARNGQFIVGEEKTLNYIVAGIFFAVFALACFDWNSLGWFVLMPLALAVFYVFKALVKRIYIRINLRGIYQDERLVTDWDNFIKAHLTQKQVVFSIQDNFILVVDYRKEGKTAPLRRTIPLTNTQNQSEEDVMAAIKFFVNAHRQISLNLDYTEAVIT